MRKCGAVLLTLFIVGCGQLPGSEPDIRAEFLRLAKGDSWARWPDRPEDTLTESKPCQRVSEPSREVAIARLAEVPAVEVQALDYLRLTGTPPPPGQAAFYLLRGFSSTNSTASVKQVGSVTTVHSDALGGISNLRRHPCIASLSMPPSEVFTVVAYDL
jgi:hypothetical protein